MTTQQLSLNSITLYEDDNMKIVLSDGKKIIRVNGFDWEITLIDNRQMRIMASGEFSSIAVFPEVMNVIRIVGG